MTFGQAFENCKLGKKIRMSEWSESTFIIIDSDHHGLKSVKFFVNGILRNDRWLPSEREMFSDNWIIM